MTKMNDIPKSLTLLPLDSLVSARFQCHFPLDENDVRFKELVDSIKETGVQQPLLVRLIDQDGKYEIVAGERRFRAAKVAGLEQVPVIIQSLDDLQATLVQGVENLQRQDLTEAEKSRYLSFIAVEFHLTAKQISEKLGMSYPWVVRYLPAEFKNEEKAEAGKLGGLAKGVSYREESAILHIAPAPSEVAAAEQKAQMHRTQCQNPACLRFVFDAEIRHIGDKDYCLQCTPKANIIFQNEQKRLEREAEKEKPRSLKPSDVEPWKDKVARMSSPISKMDEALLVKFQGSAELRELGWKIEFQKPYYRIVCRSDLTFTRGNEEVMCFWDGSEVHDEPELDEAARELARADLESKQLRAEVLAKRYKVFSDAEVERLFSEGMDFLRELEKWKEPKRETGEKGEGEVED